ncbi:hypothetical protein PUNSTDRAFT_142130 [Punctularia strigosozonata HHB-11173 SS5]|uniref:uncharacterized protein n=1 Tax=Punctularia strigosozonata (strain HHB-11173) TaxID=741275 RepID=UPI000441775C|nr:uncharacterized protein PUNSTDRAFT_142130 [Punctularia strigosozonata HHB-11173 SS5]EIN11920.1 hypothetical protein PUNSTDRAFT_142130 [Punctularia strigosozonata HHB-11173 SS5]
MQAADPYPPSSAYASATTIQLSDHSDTGLPDVPKTEDDVNYHDLSLSAAEISASQKRKIERACDFCRRRKTKCDGPKMPNHICTNCIQNRKSCTYVEASKPRGPPKAYVTALEDRIEKIDVLLKRLRPNEDFTDELGPPIVRGSWKNDPPHKRSTSAQSRGETSKTRAQTTSQIQSLSPPSSSFGSAPLPHLRSNPNSPVVREAAAKGKSPSGSSKREDDGNDESSSDDVSSDVEELGELSLTRGVKRLTFRGLEPAGEPAPHSENQLRYHGKSSSYKLVGMTRRLREEHRAELRKTETEAEADESVAASPEDDRSNMRDEFWTMPEWEAIYDGLQIDSPAGIPGLEEHFPPPDLARTLIDLYFAHVNSQFPLLHRPTFEKSWMSGLHQRDVWFACLCMSIFAVASRWSDDPRVLTERAPGSSPENAEAARQRWLLAGWKYMEVAIRVHMIKRSVIRPACLAEVQTHTLLAMFLRMSKWGPVSWLLIAVGLRKAEDVGAHRKKVYSSRPTVDEELWKRAYWTLVVQDRIGSAALGRTCCSREEDFDLDMPLEVDDEYWEHENPDKAFKQPPGKPCTVTAFVLFIKITQIQAFALRTIYAIDKSKVLLGLVGPRWPERIISELNTALTEWGEAVPPYLRWSSTMENQLFANQATTLYTSYYLTQILIYRPFIRPHIIVDPYHSSDTLPALAICASAAKSCARILEIQLPRGLSNIPLLIAVSHLCAAILILNVWHAKARERAALMEDIKPLRLDAPAPSQVDALMTDVNAFLKALEWVEPRWEFAGICLRELRKSLPPPKTEVQMTLQPPQVSSRSTPQYTQNHHQPRAYSQSQPPPRPTYEHARYYSQPELTFNDYTEPSTASYAMQMHSANDWQWFSSSDAGTSSSSYAGYGGYDDVAGSNAPVWTGPDPTQMPRGRQGAPSQAHNSYAWNSHNQPHSEYRTTPQASTSTLPVHLPTTDRPVMSISRLQRRASSLRSSRTGDDLYAQAGQGYGIDYTRYDVDDGMGMGSSMGVDPKMLQQRRSGPAPGAMMEGTGYGANEGYGTTRAAGGWNAYAPARDYSPAYRQYSGYPP